jgi:hypothetical protein
MKLEISMNKMIENKFLYIFGATKSTDISLSSIKNVFTDLASKDDLFNEQHCRQQIVELWELKYGPILIL